MKHALGLIVALLATASPVLAEPEEPGTVIPVMQASAEPTPAPRPVRPAAKPQPPAWRMPALSLHMGLVPAGRKLRAEARFTLVPPTPGLKTVRLRLHPGLSVTRVDVQWRPARYTRQGEFLDVKLGPYAPGQSLALTVGYAGRPLEGAPGNRRQDVGSDGLFLHPAGRWYPSLPGISPAASTVRLIVPPTWRAVSPSGNQAFDRDTQTYRFEFAQNEPLVVAAGRFKQVPYSGATAYMRLASKANAGAVSAELKRGAAVMDFYKAHGVFVPRLAGTVVELPPDFAPLALPRWQARPQQPGGLARWLAASQWGLGSHVSPLERQWLSESLGAFTDDMMAERQGGAAAYRRAVAAHQQAYQAFLARMPEADKPLSSAIAPNAPAHEAVVRHKGAMVWAQLRESLGEAGFWELLKGYRAGLSRGESPWVAFQGAAGPAAASLDGWLTERGLPAFHLRDVAVSEAEGGFQVTGKLVADHDGFALPLELALVTADDVQRVRFSAFGPEMPFHFVSASRPLRVMLDPSGERPIARRTTLRVAEGTAPADGLIVYGTGGSPDEAAANQEAARAWAERLKRNEKLELPIKADTEVTEEDKQRSLLLFGRPSTNALADEWADQFPVRFLKDDKGQDHALWWQGRTYTHPDFATVEIIANPAAPERTVVLFAALTAKHMADTLAYTKENTTYCVFDGNRLVEAGQALCTFPDQDAVLY